MSESLFPSVKKHYKEFILIVEFSLLIAFFLSDQNSDQTIITLFIFLISLCLVISTYVNSKKYKLILKFSAVVIFLHFLLIPMACVLLLGKDSNSFKFETEVIKSEQSISEVNNEKKYTPTQIIEKQKIINTVFNSTSTNTSRSLSELNNNIIPIDSFYIIKRGRSDIVTDHPETVYDYVICNYRGEFILISPAITNEQMTIKDYLKSLLSGLTVKQNEYKESYTNIKNGKFWTFSQMVSYTITFSDMKPISRAANWIYWFHYFIVGGFFISFLSSLFRPDIPKAISH